LEDVKMKLFFSVLIVLALAVCGFAGLDTTGLNYVEFPVSSYTNGTAYSDGATTNVVDIANYKGNARIVVFNSGNTTVNAQTNSTIVLQHATARTGTFSTVSTVTITAPASASGVVTAPIDLGTLHRYLRVGVTLQGTNSLNQYIGAVIVAP
jgi:hypothetical protein